MSTDLFKNKYRIPSTRFLNWNYGWEGVYFITICTKDKEHYFGKIENSEIVLSNLGIIADVMMYEIKNHSQNVEIDNYVIMPNHVHCILILNENDEIHLCRDKACLVSTTTMESKNEPIGTNRFQNQGKNTISSIIGSYKSAVTKHAHRLGFNFEWQSRFHDHIIRNVKEYENIFNYITENPLKWEQDKFYTKFL